MPEPRVSVIVPARDAASTLGRTLAALAVQELDAAYEVIVVDDGSTDATGQIASRARAAVKLLTQARAGPAAARNRGVAASRAPLLAFCDADVFPAPGWLAAGVAALEHSELVQGRVIPDPREPLGPFDRSLWITFHVGLFETANLFTTRQLFDRVGGFEQWLHPRWGKALAEDVWFGYRARRLGACTAFCAEALAYHAVFERSWVQYALERARRAYFPAMAKKMPELRREFLYGRAFLTERTFRFDLAVAGVATGWLRRSPLPLMLAAPYLYELRRHSLRSRPRGPRATAVAAADLIADAVGELALLAGSARHRSVVL